MKNNKTAGETAYPGKKTAGLWLAAAALSYLTVCMLSLLLQTPENRLAYTNSIFTVLLFLALALFFHEIFLFFSGEKIRLRSLFSHGKKGTSSQKEERTGWLPGVVGVGFAICMVFGYELDRRGSVPFLKLSVWIVVIVLAVLTTWIVRSVWEYPAGRTEEGTVRKTAGETVGGDAVKEQVPVQKPASPWIYGAVIFLLYLPVFLAVYPGFFVYDAQEELMQVVTRNFSTHHPLAHVLLLGGIIQAVHKLTDSYNLGIACYTLLQMAVMAGIFGWCVEKCRQNGLGKWGCRVLTAYFGLCPVLVMFSLCSAKDGLFTGVLLILVIQLKQLCREPEIFFSSVRNIIVLGFAALVMLLLRHNGFYAFLVYAVILSVFIWKQVKEEKQKGLSEMWRKNGNKLFFCLVMVLAAYFVIDTALTTLLRADDSEHQEMLTVPISQMARVNAYEKDTVSGEDQEILYRYLPEDVLGRYTPKVTDGVKIGFDNEAYEKDAGSFWRIWARWGKEHPFAYLNAWLMTSYGFWYPDTIIDVYRGNTVFTYTYEDSSYFGYEVEEPGTRESKLPWLDELYRKMSLEIAQQKIPVVSMLFSPGFLFWLMIFGLGYLGYMGEWKAVLPYGIALLIWLTFMLGPTYLVRYVVFLWALIPLLMQDIASLTSFASKDL